MFSNFLPRCAQIVVWQFDLLARSSHMVGTANCCAQYKRYILIILNTFSTFVSCSQMIDGTFSINAYNPLTLLSLFICIEESVNRVWNENNKSSRINDAPSPQIVLVDDASNNTEISTVLPLYIQARLPPKVRLQSSEHSIMSGIDVESLASQVNPFSFVKTSLENKTYWWKRSIVYFSN